MTPLAALIQHCEAPFTLRVDGEVVYSSKDEARRAWTREIFRNRDMGEIFGKEWTIHEQCRNRIESGIQFQQLAAGIPVRTIQEAIDAGEYANMVGSA